MFIGAYERRSIKTNMSTALIHLLQIYDGDECWTCDDFSNFEVLMFSSCTNIFSINLSNTATDLQPQWETACFIWQKAILLSLFMVIWGVNTALQHSSRLINTSGGQHCTESENYLSIFSADIWNSVLV